MVNRQGTPIWFELVADDADRAQAFYEKVLGWTVSRPQGGLERDYRIAQAGSDGVAGIMQAEGGMPRGWFFYVGVDDVDRSAEQVKELGGAVHMGPMDIPDVGRFAYVTDPAGAPFYIMRGFSAEDSRAYGDAPGVGCWIELATPDQDAAFAFYGALFGWRKGDIMPMGEMGDYSFVNNDDGMIGAIMNTQPDRPNAGWNFCFQVTDIDEALHRVEAAGGKLRGGPHEVPGGAFVIDITDSEGAVVYFAGSRKEGSASQ